MPSSGSPSTFMPSSSTPTHIPTVYPTELPSRTLDAAIEITVHQNLLGVNASLWNRTTDDAIFLSALQSAAHMVTAANAVILHVQMQVLVAKLST